MIHPERAPSKKFRYFSFPRESLNRRALFRVFQLEAYRFKQGHFLYL